jgi:hypothetical protein
MKSTMKFFKKAKLHENTTERDTQVREILKVRVYASKCEHLGRSMVLTDWLDGHKFIF